MKSVSSMLSDLSKKEEVFGEMKKVYDKNLDDRAFAKEMGSLMLKLLQKERAKLSEQRR